MRVRWYFLWVTTGLLLTGPMPAICQITSGPPNYFWVSSYDPDLGYEDPSIPWGSMFMPASTTLAFRHFFSERTRLRFPAVGVSPQRVRSSEFKKEAFDISSNAGMYEMLVLYSHGSPGSVQTYPRGEKISIKNTLPNPISLHNYTKYMVSLTCGTLFDQGAWFYNDAFKGGHAILGSRSDLRAFGFSSGRGMDPDEPALYISGGDRSNRIGELFSQYWIEEGMTLWGAWKMAMDVVQSRWTNRGADPAIVFAYGRDVSRNVYNASNEKIDSIYNGAVFMNPSDATNPKLQHTPSAVLAPILPFTLPLVYQNLQFGVPTYGNSTISL